MKSNLILVLAILCACCSCEAILNGYPVTFSLAGTTTFIPDAGGSQQSGYTINLGYTGASWIAAELHAITGNTDLLVVQLDDFYSTSSNAAVSGHLVSYGDYFKNASGVQSDVNTQYDISSYAYSNTKSYALPITRNLNSNSGQDWPAASQGYSVLKVCFYTSNKTFSTANYNQSISACYNYELNNLVSLFVGPFIKNFMLNGYNTSLYGYIDGPFVSAKVYLYHQTPQFAYVKVPAAAIEIGTTAGSHGQDFYVASPISTQNGDYFGSDINHLAFDNSAGGFQNQGFFLNSWNADPNNPISSISFTALRFNFSRAVYTYDSYDKTLLSTFIFCVYLYSSGSIAGSLSDKACEVVELSQSYLSMSVPSALSGEWSGYWLLAALCFLLILQ